MGQYTRLNLTVAYNKDPKKSAQKNKEQMCANLVNYLELEEYHLVEFSSHPTYKGVDIVEIQTECEVNYGFLGKFVSDDFTRELKEKYPNIVGVRARSLNLDYPDWDSIGDYDSLIFKD